MFIGPAYSAVARESVLQSNDQWIIQFDIINMEATDMTYDIVWSSGGENSTETVSVAQKRTFSYIHHVYPATLKSGIVSMSIFKRGEASPFDKVTYHLE